MDTRTRATVLRLAGVAERSSWCARTLLKIDLAAGRRTGRKDFCDALYHLDQLGAERLNVHRLELERILLAAAADCEDEEAVEISGAVDRDE